MALKERDTRISNLFILKGLKLDLGLGLGLKKLELLQ